MECVENLYVEKSFQNDLHDNKHRRHGNKRAISRAKNTEPRDEKIITGQVHNCTQSRDIEIEFGLANGIQNCPKLHGKCHKKTIKYR